MIGIDITKVNRFANRTKSFIEKVLHTEEIKEYSSSDQKDLFIATRWAIKEALFKADNSNFSFNKINIIKKNRTYQYPGYIISTSKEDDYVVAMVIKENNEHKI